MNMRAADIKRGQVVYKGSWPRTVLTCTGCVASQISRVFVSTRDAFSMGQLVKFRTLLKHSFLAALIKSLMP